MNIHCAHILRYPANESCPQDDFQVHETAIPGEEAGPGRGHRAASGGVVATRRGEGAPAEGASAKAE